MPHFASEFSAPADVLVTGAIGGLLGWPVRCRAPCLRGESGMDVDIDLKCAQPRGRDLRKVQRGVGARSTLGSFCYALDKASEPDAKRSILRHRGIPGPKTE